MSQVESAHNLLLVKLCNETHKTIIKIAAVLWGIWFVRNKKIMEHKVLAPAAIMECSMKQKPEWREVQEKQMLKILGMDLTKITVLINGQHHVEGTLKLNVDVSVVSGADFFSVGMVLNDW